MTNLILNLTWHDTAQTGADIDNQNSSILSLKPTSFWFKQISVAEWSNKITQNIENWD